MQKEIKYTGFSETPSDYECPDGDLATVVGMVPEDEAMKPIQQPQLQFKLPSMVSGETWSVVFIHKNTGFTHYIVCWERTVEINSQSVNRKYYYWIGNFTPGETPTFNANNLIVFLDDKEVYELNALGNTLMILTDDGIEYYLWKVNTYKSLGQNIPITYLSFGLQGDVATETKEQKFYGLFGDLSFDEEKETPWFADDDYVLSTDDEKRIITDGVLAHVNRFISEQVAENNKFVFPFFVRYAYRLTDESLIMHSAPVLMTTDTSAWTPRCDITQSEVHVDIVDDNYYWWVTMDLRCIAYNLDYAAFIPEHLEDWGDIVKSVDIFVSLPIYTYNQAGKVAGFHNSSNDYIEQDGIRTSFAGYTVGKIGQAVPNAYSKMLSSAYAPAIPGLSAAYFKIHNEEAHESRQAYRAFTLPYFSKEKMQDDISAVHDYYLLKSIPIEDLSTERTKINLVENYLTNLSTKERMTDDYAEGTKLIAKTSFAYNQRLNLGNLSVEASNPYVPSCYAAYANANTCEYDIYVKIEEGNKEIVVKAPVITGLSYLHNDKPIIYFYYPNSNAKKAIIKKHGTPDVLYELPLTKHDFLNGVFYYGGWYPDLTVIQDEPTPSTDRMVPMPNKLYTSEVANPFLFTSKGIQTVGVGTILGVRPIVKAMSLAQYGQHDLYVFSSDGVWSLEVDSEGYMQHPHLATPDIVLGNGGSISQIDGGVLFATDRGIMLISGSDSVCISDMLNSTSPFIPIGTTAAQDLLPGLRNVVDADMIAQMQTGTFRNFITDCRMTYDYPHQRIIVYSPTHDYAYVYSLKSKQWGMMPSKIQSTPLNYPAALAMVVGSDSRNWLVDYSKDDIVQGVIQVESGLIITRPLKLDYPDVLKTVDTIIQRGKFQKGHVKSILYGSRDLLNWQLVWSSVDHYLRGFSGTPYKYFRLALLCDLAEGEDLMGCTVQFTPRLTDQLR